MSHPAGLLGPFGLEGSASTTGQNPELSHTHSQTMLKVILKRPMGAQGGAFLSIDQLKLMAADELSSRAAGPFGPE